MPVCLICENTRQPQEMDAMLSKASRINIGRRRTEERPTVNRTTPRSISVCDVSTLDCKLEADAKQGSQNP
jgi:hypothetical protein